MPVDVVSEGGSQLTRELVLDDGTTILVEVTDVGQGTRGVFDTATKSFASAVDGLHKVATVLHREVTLAMETTAPDSVTVTFGIQISSEAGVIISKATAGATISVSMTWTRS